MPAKKPVKRRKIQAAEALKLPATPRRGERLRHEHLHPTTRKAFERISQIYGIPLNELLPFYGGSVKSQKLRGKYVSSWGEHKILIEDLGHVESLDHECVHALQTLLEKARGKSDLLSRQKRLGQKVKKRGSPSLKNLWQAAKIRYEHEKKKRKLREPLAYSLGKPPFSLHPRRLGRNLIARAFYNRHGIDGLLLVFAFPPKKQDALNLKEHEKKLVQDSYLKKHGGMTRKGIQLLHKLVPREVIVKRAKGKKPIKKK